MLRAITEDIANCEPRPQVHILRDYRWQETPSCHVFEHPVHAENEFQETIKQLIPGMDGAILIAPECDGILLQLAELIESLGGVLLSPGAALCRWTSNKQTTVERLHAAGIPVPRGVLVGAFNGDALDSDWTFPLVAKPFDGAGSQRLRFIRSYDHLRQCLLQQELCEQDRLEEFVPGIPASVAVVADGMGGIFPLSPCFQHLTHDGGFRYLGGELVTRPALVERGRKLAEKCATVLQDARGYIGIDFVYGSSADGTADTVIEINPRLTTSYVALRQRATRNLAYWLLSPLLGIERLPPEFTLAPCLFRANGEILTGGC